MGWGHRESDYSSSKITEQSSKMGDRILKEDKDYQITGRNWMTVNH